MAKIAKSPIPKGAFNKPTEEEVFQFINRYMQEWPERFCRHMAAKFVNFYTSNGWKVSGRAAMKDFEACFKAQWKELKYREDKELLQTCLMEPIHRMRQAEKRRQADGIFAEQYGTATVGSDKPLIYWLEFYEKIMASWSAGQLTWKQLWPHYDRLKALGVMKIPKAQIDAIFVEMGNNRDMGKGLSIIRLFQNLTEKGLTLTQFHSKIQQQKQNS